MTQCHDDYERDALATTRLALVRDVMTSPAITVEQSATVKEIAHLLLTHDIRAVPVVDAGHVPVGVVSEADVVCRECPTVRHHTLGGLLDHLVGHGRDWASKAEGITAGEIMTRPVISCAPTEPVTTAARRMLSHDVHMLPVLQDGRLVGVVSRHDILRVFDRPDAEVRSRIASLLSSRVWVPEGHTVTAEVNDGVVHLSGTVRYPSDIEIVAALVAAIPGVIDVYEDLAARESEPKPSYSTDADWS